MDVVGTELKPSAPSVPGIENAEILLLISGL